MTTTATTTSTATTITTLPSTSLTQNLNIWTMSGTGTSVAGLASNINTTSIVQQMMNAAAIPLEQMQQQDTWLQWKKTAYNTVYTNLQSFDTNIDTYKLQSTLEPSKVTTTGTSVAKVTANATAVNSTHTLNVKSLAAGLTYSSPVTGISGSNSQTSLASQFPGIFNAVSGASTTASFAIDITNGSKSASITVSPTESIGTFVSQINNSGANLKASYDAYLDKFTLATTNVGNYSSSNTAGVALSFAGTDATGVAFLNSGLQLGVNTTGTVNGTDASFVLDGVSKTSSTNTIFDQGVTYNMTGVTGADDTTMSVSLATDTSAIETAVNSFVSTYNSMLAQINGDIAQQRNTAYPPLTSTQQSQMTDTDVADWNAAAQQGMLFQDPTLSALSREMQSDVTTPVSGITSSQYNSLASIGITSTDWKNGGLLTVDSTKLEQALATDPTSVYQILGKQGATSATQGVAYRLDTTMTKAMANIAHLAGTPSTTSYDTTSSLAIQISHYTTQITKEDAYLTGVQQRYQSQFSQMESVIQQMNSQSSFLSSSSSSSSSSG